MHWQNDYTGRHIGCAKALSTISALPLIKRRKKILVQGQLGMHFFTIFGIDLLPTGTEQCKFEYSIIGRFESIVRAWRSIMLLQPS